MTESPAGLGEVVGRDAESREVEDFLNEVPSGLAVLAIEGAPGIGKSTIWRSALVRARDRGWRVLSCEPGDDTAGPPSGETSLLPLVEGPCPSCTALLDQLDGATEHASQHLNLAVVAKAPLPRILTFARERGWRRLRLFSSAANSYNRDYHAETADGAQRPMMSVFHRDGSTIRHFWSSELLYAPADSGEDPRHVGTLEPLWNLFDLTPEGRPSDWYEQFSY